MIFGTEAEASPVAGIFAGRLVVRLGADGVRIAGRHRPAASAAAADSTGAGDAFAAGYLAGGITLGRTAATRAVAKMGAMQ